MFLRCLSLILFSGICVAGELRVCADPDNLPFSHAEESGFENRIATLLAAELDKTLAYTWHPQRRGFVRKTIGAKVCDVWIGVPADFERVIATRPYYRSAYVFVSAKTRRLSAFDDLKGLRVGVELPGDDGAATPPGHALAARGIQPRGYSMYGATPAAQRIVQALARGELDAAVTWGPATAYFASASNLAVVPVANGVGPFPFHFAIAVGVRRGEIDLRDALDGALERRRREVEAVLDEFRVPRL